MKVTVITVCYNAAAHIDETLRSVIMQDYPDIEHIVIDGGSTDGTQDRVRRYSECIAHFVSEPDGGVYDAMNKGLRMATGEVVAFVNAGDMIATRHTVSRMAQAFSQSGLGAVYGDVLMVDPDDIHKVRRFWKGGAYRHDNFKRGWMPPHPGTYIRKSAYDRFGLFNTELEVGADYELLFRMLYRHRLPARYIPHVAVRFRLGGMSNASLSHVLKANIEVRRSWRLNGFQAPPLLVTRKLWSKVMQFLH